MVNWFGSCDASAIDGYDATYCSSSVCCKQLWYRPCETPLIGLETEPDVCITLSRHFFGVVEGQ